MTAAGSSSPIVLYGRPGWGSAIVEAQLVFYGMPMRLEDVDDLFASADARERLAPVNPLAQVPAVVLPDGTVMTESAAITLHLADLAGHDGLVPGPQARERAAFLRWLVFLVANVYPTFTYADVPTRFVADEQAAPGFQQAVNAYARRLWGIVEGACGTPWFLGERFSALDVYLAVMTRWRPGAAWFAENAPMLAGVAARAAAQPTIAPVMARHFLPPAPAPEGPTPS